MAEVIELPAQDAEPTLTLLATTADIVEWLPDIVRETRKAAGLSMVQVETATGVARATLNRVEGGGSCTTTTAAKLLRWAATA